MKKNNLLLLLACIFIYSSCKKNTPPVPVIPVARIIYTDINPGHIYSTGSVYHLDINNDGTNDFDIYDSSFVITLGGECHGVQKTNSSIGITPQQDNGVLSDVNSRPNISNPGDTINEFSSYYWANTPYLPIRYKWWMCRAPGTRCYICVYQPATIFDGNWSDTTSAYMGLKVIKENNAYYGWIRLSVNYNPAGDSAFFTIRDFAYNSTPNQAILAGQTK